MDEVGLPSAQHAGKLNGIINRLMRTMSIGAQAIDYQRIYPLQSTTGLLGSREHIGHKPQAPYTISENGQSSVHHLQGSNFYTLDSERTIRLDGMKVQARDTWVQNLTEEIGKPLAQMGTREVIGIEVYITKATERTQVVNSSRMVIVLVSEEHSIQAVKGYAQHLLAKVGATIDKYTRIGCLHQGRHTQTMVAPVT